MKKTIVLMGIVIVLIGLFGCSFNEPSIKCSANKIIEDISTLPDEQCNKKYNNKYIEVSGMVMGINYNENGILYYPLAMKWGAYHNWYVAAYFTDKSNAKEAKSLKNGLLVTLRGTAKFVIHDDGERAVRIINAKLVE